MATFVLILRILVDIVLGRVFAHFVFIALITCGLGVTLAFWIALVASIAVVVHPKTALLYKLVREFALYWLIKLFSVFVKVPGHLYGPSHARSAF